jgi:hypothetical protein
MSEPKVGREQWVNGVNPYPQYPTGEFVEEEGIYQEGKDG